MNLFESKGKILIKKKFRLNNEQYLQRISPDRIQNLFKEVDFHYNKLSPSNCSKNILAISSNIDSEIELAKHEASFSNNLTSRTHGVSLTPSRPRILPKLNFSPSKMTSFKDHSVSEISSYTPIDFKAPKEPKSKRLIKIDEVMLICSGLKQKLSSEKSKLAESHKANFQTIEIQDRSLEKNIVERCKKHFEKLDRNNEDAVKLTNVLRRGKKVWKQNHIAFIKNIDRLVNSVRSSKLESP